MLDTTQILPAEFSLQILNYKLEYRANKSKNK